MSAPRYPTAHASLRAALAALLLAVALAPSAVGVAASAAWNSQPAALEALPVERQTHPLSCGPATLATLSTWLGTARTEAELLAAAEVGPEGITLSEFARLAHRIGLAGSWYQVAHTDLHHVPTPFAAHLRSGGYLQGSGHTPELGHLVAIAGVAHGYVAVADPATGAHVLPLNAFAQRFSGRVYVLDERAREAQQ